MRFIKLMAIALPVTLLVSCAKDGPKDGGDSQFVRDGENYIIESWLRYDADGNKAGSVYGLAMDESNPTVRVIGVDNLQQAQEHFRNILAPPEAKVIVDGDNMTVQLTDTEGNVKNNLFFKTENDGKILARVTLEKKVGVEQFVTEFLYMLEGKCADYQLGGDDCPFEEGCIYFHSIDGNAKNDKYYLCLCLPTSEGPGLLVGDSCEYLKIASNTNRESGKACANMPRIEIFNQIWTLLNKNSDEVSSDLLWQRLCATSGYFHPIDDKNYEYRLKTNRVPDFKTRIYWVNEMPYGTEDITIFNLEKGCLGSIEPKNPYVSWSQDTAEWVMSAYMFYYIGDKIVVERCTSQNMYSSEWKDKWPSPDSFTRSLECEKLAESISLQ